MQMPFVVGIAGGTCSGKSTLADRLERRLGEHYRVSVLHMDHYYKNPGFTTVAPVTRVEYPEHNHPDALDTDALFRDFKAMLNAKSVDIILIEGLFALLFDAVRQRLDLKVFVDLPSDERLYRRIKRWSNQSGMDEVASRYLDTVRYRHDELVEPTRWHANLILNGGSDSDSSVGILVDLITARLRRHPIPLHQEVLPCPSPSCPPTF